jgi:hypothetical protein
MRVLLLRPIPSSERFGLGPFCTQDMMDPKHYLREHTFTVSRMRRQSAA